MQGWQLLMVGVSHRTAPLELRESLALDEARRLGLMAALREMAGVREFALLSTCNRVEVYALVGDAESQAALVAAYCAATRLDPAAFQRYAVQRSGADAVLHLMMVSVGLDSQMIGETEILGQVKQCYADATTAGSVGPVLHKLFQKSFQAAKWARTHTGVGEGVVSLGNVAVDLARRIFGKLQDSRVMIVGSGSVGADVGKALRNRGVHEISVTSRTPGRSATLAAEITARHLPFETWVSELHRSDIVIFCTSAPQQVLTRELAAQAIAKRPARPLFLIDLALPRDVDTAVDKLVNVFLYTFDDLAAIANENMKGRMRQIDQCKAILAERAERLWGDLAEGPGAPVSQA